jgi:hypothetical protein
LRSLWPSHLEHVVDADAEELRVDLARRRLRQERLAAARRPVHQDPAARLLAVGLVEIRPLQRQHDLLPDLVLERRHAADVGEAHVALDRFEAAVLLRRVAAGADPAVDHVVVVVIVDVVRLLVVFVTAIRRVAARLRLDAEALLELAVAQRGVEFDGAPVGADRAFDVTVLGARFGELHHAARPAAVREALEHDRRRRSLVLRAVTASQQQHRRLVVGQRPQQRQQLLLRVHEVPVGAQRLAQVPPQRRVVGAGGEGLPQRPDRRLGIHRRGIGPDGRGFRKVAGGSAVLGEAAAQPGDPCGRARELTMCPGWTTRWIRIGKRSPPPLF